MSVNLDSFDIHRASDYGRDGHPWAAWDALRTQAPVYWYDRPDVEPFRLHGGVGVAGPLQRQTLHVGGIQEPRQRPDRSTAHQGRGVVQQFAASCGERPVPPVSGGDQDVAQEAVAADALDRRA